MRFHLQPGAFDDAVKGVDAVEHLASPVFFSFKDPDGEGEPRHPAFQATVLLLY